MNSVKRCISIVGLYVLFVSCRDNRLDYSPNYEEKQKDSKAFNFLPSNTTGAVYKHDAYTFSYSEVHEQAEWVAYVLKASDIKEIDYKRPYFEVDPMVITGSAHWKNYKNSGYNKGHLCPAGDRRASFKDYESTFFTSNIAPQKHEFNAGIWNRLEQKVRYWAKMQDSLYVVTGGVLTSNLDVIGSENVAVPKYFYKVLLSIDGTKMIGFLVPHEKSNKALYSFITPVDKIEELTGIDFFPSLNDELENRLEAKSDYSNWDF